jgi:hypothetical protein
MRREAVLFERCQKLLNLKQLICGLTHFYWWPGQKLYKRETRRARERSLNNNFRRTLQLLALSGISLDNRSLERTHWLLIFEFDCLSSLRLRPATTSILLGSPAPTQRQSAIVKRSLPKECLDLD